MPGDGAALFTIVKHALTTATAPGTMTGPFVKNLVTIGYHTVTAVESWEGGELLSSVSFCGDNAKSEGSTKMTYSIPDFVSHNAINNQ